MNRRHFLGALAAAVVAPWLPKMKADEPKISFSGKMLKHGVPQRFDILPKNHPFQGKGTAISTGPCAVCNEAVTMHATIVMPDMLKRVENPKPIMPGDRVRLNSGSPDLRVIMITPKSDYIHAEWIDGDGRRRAHPFPAACVYKVSEAGQFGNITARWPLERV